MANATVAQAITRTNVAQALRAARIACVRHQAWLNALNRAALNLESCPWQFDGDALSIASATNPGRRYVVTTAGCECKAAKKGTPCWHRAGYRLLCRAAELAARPTPAPSMADVQAAVDEIFA